LRRKFIAKRRADLWDLSFSNLEVNASLNPFPRLYRRQNKVRRACPNRPFGSGSDH